ncbi:Squalene-hopene cyclase C-terminal domain-containing protein [Natronoarchaeum philippinense]|uniref:Squalene-hopene cyclase C-terminal domain-containing protein n=1 Tax=Natronoarchaeum philippinense TaxID=558529 RepID=A0A285P562_NATPI|nr:prenyltransferase/squalene oxidase repeat-containing protein [Natronoarchaeum philippinense]SNZ15011.1 Squalene-hopene cyclase C-terminal domain-containing protein [Natronoarchaeum philippinense]
MDWNHGRRSFLGSLTAAPFVTTPAAGQQSAVDDAVRQAIERSRSYLRDAATDGDFAHWDTTVGYGEYGDLRYTAYYALLLERVGAREAIRDRCIGHLLDRRSADGGWGDAVTNFSALLLFELIDDADHAAVIEDIQDEIDRLGHSLLPSDDRDDAGVRVSERFRVRLCYALLSDRYAYDELFPADRPVEIGRLLSLTPAFDGTAISARENMSRPIHIGPLSAYFLLGAAARDDPLGEDEQVLADAFENVLRSRRLPNGAWNTSPTTIFGALALAERGFDLSDDEVRLPVDWLADNRVTEAGRVEIWRLPVWDTGLVIEALLESGLSPSDPLLRDAARWLYRARTPQVDVNPVDAELDRSPAPFRRHHGDGWGYMPHAFSDWDDTGLAISALSAFAGPALDEQTAFLLDVQNRDGSWSAYTTDYEPFDDAAAETIRSRVGDGLYRVFFGYVPSPDVTGGALAALGKRGHTVRDSEAVRDAVDYLTDATADNDLWLGVWAQGFTYGTARVLGGLRRVGVDPSREYVQAAAQSLIEQQNDDGGWGEATRYDPARSTPGNVPYQSADSTPTQTGWALQALLYAGISPDNPAIQDGIDYLLRMQDSTGAWTPDRVMYNFGGPGYSTDATTQAAALAALGSYASARAASTDD